MILLDAKRPRRNILSVRPESINFKACPYSSSLSHRVGWILLILCPKSSLLCFWCRIFESSKIEWAGAEQKQHNISNFKDWTFHTHTAPTLLHLEKQALTLVCVRVYVQGHNWVILRGGPRYNCNRKDEIIHHRSPRVKCVTPHFRYMSLAEVWNTGGGARPQRPPPSCAPDGVFVTLRPAWYALQGIPRLASWFASNSVPSRVLKNKIIIHFNNNNPWRACA